jgi:hypothetical protein
MDNGMKILESNVEKRITGIGMESGFWEDIQKPLSSFCIEFQWVLGERLRKTKQTADDYKAQHKF